MEAVELVAVDELPAEDVDEEWALLVPVAPQIIVTRAMIRRLRHEQKRETYGLARLGDRREIQRRKLAEALGAFFRNIRPTI